MYGIVLSDQDIDYSDMTAIGEVVVKFNAETCEVETIVNGFQFREAQGCRSHVARAIAWTRDVLTAKLGANKLIPGGQIASISGADQTEVDSARASVVDQ